MQVAAPPSDSTAAAVVAAVAAADAQQVDAPPSDSAAAAAAPQADGPAPKTKRGKRKAVDQTAVRGSVRNAIKKSATEAASKK